MKKFIITEDEKSRILGMHQNATSRQYLNESEMGNVKPLISEQIVAGDGDLNSIKIL